MPRGKSLAGTACSSNTAANTQDTKMSSRRRAIHDGEHIPSEARLSANFAVPPIPSRNT